MGRNYAPWYRCRWIRPTGVVFVNKSEAIYRPSVITSEACSAGLMQVMQFVRYLLIRRDGMNICHLKGSLSSPKARHYASGAYSTYEINSEKPQ